MKNLTINGMHCNACESLIKMELEENNLDALVAELKATENNQGVLTIQDDVSDENLEKIKSVINNMEKYSVV